MALSVNPTRMELYRLKKRLTTARRGHKLLKDKQDEMIRQFMAIIKRTRALRIDVEKALAQIMNHFASARMKMSEEGTREALMVPSRQADLSITSKSVMNIKTPKIEYRDQGSIDLTYGFAFTPSELDTSVVELSHLLPALIELASLEKSCDLLATEIEKTRRRVNAIEFIMIPEMQDAIHYITMKLEDNERGNITRLMKSKEIILAKSKQKTARSR
ncbi:MAG TPA: V-type ATP synthase subunit D [Candidatus Izemoplasmatales bacterium]|nr:V-type ATP synthase subunit D [Bacillota bacterium]HRY78130.1 V-type ATP synthase subunit D [Candidatus Izemoplasmatales bacterium]